MKKFTEAITNSLPQLSGVPEFRSNPEMPSALSLRHFITNPSTGNSNSPVKRRLSRVNPNHLPCTRCGSTERKLGAGKTPASGSLLCAGCGKFIRWMAECELNALASQLKGGLR